jgi:hypothetical protein
LNIHQYYEEVHLIIFLTENMSIKKYSMLPAKKTTNPNVTQMRKIDAPEVLDRF